MKYDNKLTHIPRSNKTKNLLRKVGCLLLERSTNNNSWIIYLINISQSFQVSILTFVVYEYLLNIAPVKIRMRNEARFWECDPVIGEVPSPNS